MLSWGYLSKSKNIGGKFWPVQSVRLLMFESHKSWWTGTEEDTYIHTFWSEIWTNPTMTKKESKLWLLFCSSPVSDSFWTTFFFFKAVFTNFQNSPQVCTSSTAKYHFSVITSKRLSFAVKSQQPLSLQSKESCEDSYSLITSPKSKPQVSASVCKRSGSLYLTRIFRSGF